MLKAAENFSIIIIVGRGVEVSIESFGTRKLDPNVTTMIVKCVVFRTAESVMTKERERKCRLVLFGTFRRTRARRMVDGADDWLAGMARQHGI